MTPAPRLLIVEDEALIALDMETQLTRLGYTVLGVVDTGIAAVRQVAEVRPDLVLMDIRIKGDLDGIETATQLRTVGAQIPVIFLTAHADEATLQRAGLAEPFGYLVKPFDERTLHATIEMALYRHQAEKRLHAMERWLTTTLQSIGEGVLATDAQGRVNFLNPGAERLTGWSRREALGRPLTDVFRLVQEDSRAPLPDLVEHTRAHGIGFNIDAKTRLLTRDGRLLPIDNSVAPIRDEDGRCTGAVLICRDRSERQRLDSARRQIEEQLWSAQKFESLGVLAGGLAHQFNNLLAGILGYTELCMLELPQEAPIQPYLQHIAGTSHRAAALCTQMLAYAGRGPGTEQPLAMNTLVQDTVTALQPVLSPLVSWHLHLDATLPPVLGDPGQIHHVIVNLLQNAAEALDQHPGSIRLTTGTMRLTPAYLAATVAAPVLPIKTYVFLEVTDTGSGMPADVLSRIFDPFFTTKFLGRGLGLAAVLGIVHQHHGALKADSSPGQGSTFRVLLPMADTPTSHVPPSDAAAPAQPAMGHVLIIDDTLLVRQVTSSMVAALGFEPLAVASGPEALELWQHQPPGLTAALVDLTMSDMDGIETLRALRHLSPTLPIVLISGYAEQDVAARLALDSATAFLHKPFTVNQLRETLHRLLALQAG